MSVTPETVQELLSSQDFGDRLRAVNQIRQLEPAVGYELLQSAVNDANVRVRYAAVSQLATLGKQNPERSLKTLQGLLLDPESDVQAAAADAVGALQLTDAYEDLHKLYHRSSEWLVKFSIVAALGELGDQRAFALLEEALNSDNELLKTAAIGSLGELGDDRAVELLVPYASNPDWQIRYRVAQALVRLGSAAASPTLETLAKDEVEQVAQAAKTHSPG
jgi:HEAT repeat protein